MSTFDGSFPEMSPPSDVLTLDDGTAERLLRGVLTVDDAPPAYRDVAVVIAALHAPPTARELAGERRMVPFIARRISESTPATRVTPTKTKRGHGRLRVALVTLVVAIAMLMSLATAGALPATAQRVASDVLAEVGISVPSPDSHSDSVDPGTSSTNGSSNSDANGNGATVSGAAHSDSTGVEHGSDVSSIASDGQSNAGVNGNHLGQVGAQPGKQDPEPTTSKPENENNGKRTGQSDPDDSSDTNDIGTAPDEQS
jgi:hypothetical protein